MSFLVIVSSPPSPNPSQPLIVGLTVGLIAGFVLALTLLPALLARFKTSSLSPASSSTPTPTLAIPRLASTRRRPPTVPGAAPTKGSITLVGAGTGSPDLLTLAAYEALMDADVVICDKIASDELKSLAPKGAVVLEAEKIPGRADTAQDELNAWGIDALKRGKRVVRLKVGDPFLYGRGGEEVQFYASHGFLPDVIPGVTSALVAPLVAGIPVTHRGAANQLLITTGQGRGGTFPDLPGYDSGRTLVMLMAVGRIPFLLNDLTSRGYPADTPVAVVERTTHSGEKVLKTTLDRLHAESDAAGVKSPAVIVVGTVVGALSDVEAVAAQAAAQAATVASDGWAQAAAGKGAVEAKAELPTIVV